MSLKDDLYEALSQEWKDGDRVFDPAAVTDVVWAVLEDKIGTAQEALFNQLTMVRSELEASRRREAELRASLSAVQSQLVAAQDEED